MKQCTKCKIFKNKELFNKNIKCLDGLDYKCKTCWATYRRSYRYFNLKKLREYTNTKRANRIKWFYKIKSNVPCTDCEKIYEPYCMDYDHNLEKGNKIKDVSRMVLDNTPKFLIIKEIKKCDLVCLLCHNKRTFDRFNKSLGNTRKYKSHQLRNINIINNFKNKPCTICYMRYESYNMQIDHIDPSNKLYNVCQLKSRKIETLYNELNKCQVLCALCHRKKSILEQKNGLYKERTVVTKKVKLYCNISLRIKECGMCRSIKPIEMFRLNKKMLSGIDTYCKSCFNMYRREKRKNNTK
jgi:hypothetical protein